MGGIKGLLSSKVGITFSPASATLAGAAVGCIFTILGAMMPPRDFSLRELASLAFFFLVPLCGTFGYVLWICSERSRCRALLCASGFASPWSWSSASSSRFHPRASTQFVPSDHFVR